MSEGLSEPAGGVEGEAVAVEVEAPGVVETEAPEGVAAASPWAPPQEDWQALQDTVQRIAQHLQPAAPPAPAPPSFLQTDETTGESFVDPAGLQAFIQHQIQHGIQERISQYEPVMNQVVGDQGERLVQERFAELQTTVGAFDTDVARQIAEGIAARTNDPFGAMQQAAQIAHQQHQAIGAAAVEEYKRTLGNIGNAPHEPGASSGGVQSYETPVGPNGKRDYKAVSDNWLARQQLPA